MPRRLFQPLVLELRYHDRDVVVPTCRVRRIDERLADRFGVLVPPKDRLDPGIADEVPEAIRAEQALAAAAAEKLVEGQKAAARELGNLQVERTTSTTAGLRPSRRDLDCCPTCRQPMAPCVLML